MSGGWVSGLRTGPWIQPATEVPSSLSRITGSLCVHTSALDAQQAAQGGGFSSTRRGVTNAAQEREVRESPSLVPTLPQPCPPGTSPVPAWASDLITLVASLLPGTQPARQVGSWRLHAPPPPLSHLDGSEPADAPGPPLPHHWVRTPERTRGRVQEPGDWLGSARPLPRVSEEPWCASPRPECAQPCFSLRGRGGRVILPLST